ncbi:nitrate- and nitrite sensing domain-containing protein [Streptomyces sp. NPDC093225]|uniref:sensor histidine kinase n=1 Tax=Streptomyces sp. NPDC093225 TaxID=3366034 RepID=UPI00380AFA00
MRLRTLLIWLAVVPTVAMGTQTVLTADRLLTQSQNLRADVEAGQRLGEPLFQLVAALQSERTLTAAARSGGSLWDSDLREARNSADFAVAAFRGPAATGAERSAATRKLLIEVTSGLDDLAAQRKRADDRTGGPDRTVGYYTELIDGLLRFSQDEFSHGDDGRVSEDGRAAVALLTASEMVAREDALLALAGPARELTALGFASFLEASGSQPYLFGTSIVPFLPPADRERYERITGSGPWQTKLRIEGSIRSNHKDTNTGVRLPFEVTDWRAAHEWFAPQLAKLGSDRGRAVLAEADAKAGELEREVFLLVGGSAALLLAVVALVVLTTRSVLRRLDGLHRRTVAVAERTLPEVVARLHRGQDVDDAALPQVRGDDDEVGRINDAFARVVAVSVDGHRQLAAERQGFGMFASGLAARTGNLVSRQLSLTEDIQDAFGHDEALLAQLMRADQLTVGMRRQIENLLILSGGEIPDPHTDPMRIADLLREAAAEVEDFRRIERQALDEASVEPHVISQTSHLLAELLDNATRFSPPRSTVVIRAERVADGLSVEIEDRGPRVSGERYEEMNARLHSAPPYSVLADNAHRLGLFVVGHLADQLGARVTLRRSVYGGTSAVVILPAALLAAERAEDGAAGAARRPVRATARPGREVVRSVPEPAREPAREPVREPAAAVPAPVGPAPDPVAPVPAAVGPGPVAAVAAPATLPVRATPAGGGRPPLPERVPQTHMTDRLRGPRAPEPAPAPDEATPEEVADAWDDYEQGTQTVERELRRDQP